MMDATAPIGFIDSGVGGLTVVREALRQLPHENVMFLGDQARLPYGPRPAAQVRSFTWQMVNYLRAQHIKRWSLRATPPRPQPGVTYRHSSIFPLLV